MTHTKEIRWRASEIKFVVDADTGERYAPGHAGILEPDPHGAGAYGDEYQDDDIVLRYGRGRCVPSTWLVRACQVPNPPLRRQSDVIFLERKLRQPGMLVKRRTQAPLDVLETIVIRANGGTGLVAGSSGVLAARGLRPSVSSRMTAGPRHDNRDRSCATDARRDDRGRRYHRGCNSRPPRVSGAGRASGSSS